MTFRPVVLVAGPLFGGCFAGTPPPVSAPQPVILLMECVECWSGELPTVVALGSHAVPSLGLFLRTGPPGDRVTRLETAMARSLTDSAVAPLPPLNQVDRAAVVAKQVTDYRTMYQTRAAQALGLIGGSESKSHLCAARATGQTPTVLDAIDAALAAIGTACP